MSDAPSLDALARLAADARAMLDAHGLTVAGDTDADRVTSPAIESARGLVAAVDALRAEREARAQAERERGVYRDDAHRLAAANGRLVDEADAAQRGLRAAEAQRDALAAAAREVGGLIAEHGCSCDCDCAHTTGEHTSACDPCLACRASDVVSPLLRGAAPDVVRAGVVRAYLDADARSAIGTHRDAVALADARAALLAALAAAEGR